MAGKGRGRPDGHDRQPGQAQVGYGIKGEMREPESVDLVHAISEAGKLAETIFGRQNRAFFGSSGWWRCFGRLALLVDRPDRSCSSSVLNEVRRVSIL